jgi:RHH-type proline utilization regulon transcriptional repressor/proline dehydrogenase/delta 1-pyrroline-5-carboxylate dehydrogenase
MSAAQLEPAVEDVVAALPPAQRDEREVVTQLLQGLEGLDWQPIAERARPWLRAMRAEATPFWALESLLSEYPISSSEGLALMRLAEALLRVPDQATADVLLTDQLSRVDFREQGDASLMHRLSNQVLRLSRRILSRQESDRLSERLGKRVVVQGALRAITLLGRQFVLGETLAAARTQAAQTCSHYPSLRFSYDMLGEGARNAADAARYTQAYRDALLALAKQPAGRRGPEDRDGISIKLSALHPRFEESQRQRLWRELLPVLVDLAELAAAGNLGLTLDAEESDRLELQLDLLDALQAHLHGQVQTAGWQGLGLALQAYQSRAADALEYVVANTRRHRGRLMLRLVKGAYWDTEIKRAQEMGLDGYPVFTHKHHTDVSYLACARRMLGYADGPGAPLYAQFATHNATSIAAVLEMAAGLPAPQFEMQRLHGMGERLYDLLMDRQVIPRLRIYAPVGPYRELLPYLVRRVLENGASTSFIHLLASGTGDAAELLLRSPLWAADAPALPLPRAIYGTLHGEVRPNSAGIDLPYARALAGIAARARSIVITPPADVDPEAAQAIVRELDAAQPAWDALGVSARAQMLWRAADLLEERREYFIALIQREGHKTLGDAVAELREAADYCRYYALQAKHLLATQKLPGPTGEENRWSCRGRGVFVCISPWNFPLAIFTGQVVAALVTGNTVAAKPAEQTRAIAAAMVDLLREAGVPPSALRLVPGPGHSVGAALVAHPQVAGVVFTGSTSVAKGIQRALAAKDGPIVPLIAETGGINCMIVDSSALPEQVVDAVLRSAFQSAGQRCSALRVLCVQKELAERLLPMLQGAMDALSIGSALDFATDVPPVIDAGAQRALCQQMGELERTGARLLHRCAWPEALRKGAEPGGSVLHLDHRDDRGQIQHFVAPSLYAIDDLTAFREEIFGPVLQVCVWESGKLENLLEQIRSLGYGLTLGVQTRIDDRARTIAARCRVGNVYVNRSMIGAVVGVQPFGGEGLSGTGPKAGGPLYLSRMVAEQTIAIDLTAAGGNAGLLAQGKW